MAAKSGYQTYLNKALPRSAAGSPPGTPRGSSGRSRNLDGPSVRDAGRAPKPAGRVAGMGAPTAIKGTTRVSNRPVRLPFGPTGGGSALMAASRKKGPGTPMNTGGATAY